MSDSRVINLKMGRQPVDFDDSEKLNRRYGYISWGKKNDTPYKYIDMLQKSAIHQGIINTKVSYIVSDGFDVVRNGAGVQEFLENKGFMYDMNEVAEMCAYDYETFNGFALRGIWSIDGTRAYFEHMDLDKLRATEDENVWLYSDDWSAGRQEHEKTGYREYNLLDLNNRSGDFLFIYKAPQKVAKGTNGIYPSPVYRGGLDAIQTDIEISRYHLKEILNGFSGGTLLSVPDPAPTNEEERDEAREFKRKLTGSQNAGEVFMYFSGDSDKEMQVIHLSGNDLDKRYEMLEKNVVERIVQAHSVTSPILMGVKTEGQLGGTTELETAFQIFRNTYIKKRQKAINWVFNFLMKKCNGVEGEIELPEAQAPFQVQSEQPALPATENFEKKKDKLIEDAIAVFSKYGKPIEECVFLKTGREQVPEDYTSEQVAKFESEKIKTALEEIGGVEIENKTANILGLINKGESPATIAKIVGDNPKSVIRAMERLIREGYLSDTYEITERGQRILEIVNTPVDTLEVRYTYEKRGGIPGATIIPTSRDFCRQLIALNRAYTRAEIDAMSNEFNTDVWRFRGGWYHNPETDRNVPFCRHVWQFNLTRSE